MSRAAESPRAKQGRATRIRDLLRSQILADGAAFMVPSEEGLARQYGVSRNTMREALAMLVTEGLLRRRRGVGTQLVVDRQSRVYGTGRGLAVSLPELAPRISHENLDLEIVPSAPYLARHFGSHEKTFVYWERMTLIDGGPQSIWRSHLPASIFASLVDNPPPPGETVYDTVSAVSGFEVAHTRRTVEARSADAVTARRVHVPAGFPMLHIERSMFGPDGQPLELGYAWTRGDRYAVTYDSDLDPRTSSTGDPH